MSVVINGSGTITGVTAGGLPSASITQANLATGVAGTGPAFSAYAGATTTISQNAYTKINFNTKEFDTNTNYDTSTSRFTPTVAGYYQVNGGMEYSNSSAQYVNVSIYKNGAWAKAGTNSSTAGNYRVYVSALVYLNGSTDYIELYGFSNAAGGTSMNYATSTYFQAALVRAA